MESLPDDVLLLVLGQLPMGELLRARGVCRRWRCLAVHPQVWRQRTLDDEYVRPAVFEAVLRLAPCVQRIVTGFAEDDISSALLQCGIVPATTKCAAAQLMLSIVDEPSAILGALVIHNQAILGRLVGLSVYFGKWILPKSCSRGVQDLMEAVYSTCQSGVQFLLLIDSPDSKVISRSVPRARSIPISLKGLSCNSGAVLSYLVPSLSATLEHLVVTDQDTDPEFKLIPCVQSFRNLRTLEFCPLVKFQDLVSLQNLSQLVLNVNCNKKIDLVAVEDTKAFLRVATHLTKLHLRPDFKSCVAESLFSEFILAVANSGSSKLQELYCMVESMASLLESVANFCFDPEDDSNDLNHSGCKYDRKVNKYPVYKTLVTALPGLRQLRRLEIEFEVTDAFLDAVSAKTAPNLLLLTTVIPDDCAHTWMHRPAVLSCFQRNPQLHIMTWSGMCPVPACTACAKPCHMNLRCFGCYIGLFGHEAGSCSLEEGHASTHLWIGTNTFLTTEPGVLLS